MEFLSMKNYEIKKTDSVRVLLFTTPLCGTCQLAKEMMFLCLTSLNKKLPTFECRVTNWQPYVQKWKIESVPCVIFEKDGKILEKVYAVESVSKLFGLYKKYLNQAYITMNLPLYGWHFTNVKKKAIFVNKLYIY